MTEDDIEKQLGDSQTMMVDRNPDRISLLIRQIKLLERYLNEEQESPQGPCLLYEFDGKIHQLPIGERVEVGRSETTEVTIEGPGLSRKHFAIAYVKDEGAVIEDLGSKNQTIINDVEMTKAVLVSGDVIEAGSLTFTYLED